MPTQETPPSDQLSQRVGVLRKSLKGNYPPCPQCGRRMTVKNLSPVPFATGIDDVVYGCEDCGTEIKKTVRRT